MIIAYIAYIRPDGQIDTLTSVPGSPPEDETYTEDGRLIKHITQAELDSMGWDSPADLFHEGHIWKNSSWVFRGHRPSIYYEWDVGTEAWKLNSSAIETKVRLERDIRLGGSDWTQLPDSPLTEEAKQQWRDYRQQLREVPSNIPAELEDPDLFNWPEEP